jgi:hypothetical protein
VIVGGGDSTLVNDINLRDIPEMEHVNYKV